MDSETSKHHLIYLCLGANLGDRESNLVEALNRLRPSVEVLRISPAYETDPVDFTDQPKFLNLVCEARTDLDPDSLLHHVKQIETQLGRLPQEERYRPRPIDIDILLYGGQIVQRPELTIPHEKLAERAFVLVPLADLAPTLRHPVTGRTIAEHLAAVGTAGVIPVRHALFSGHTRDIQSEEPRHAIALDRVGLSGLRRVICLTTSGKPRHLPAQLNLSVSLPRQQKGTHMSRLGLAVEEALADLVQAPAPNIETLSATIAGELRKRLDAVRADIEIVSEFPLTRRTPVSGLSSQEVYTLLAWGAAGPRGTASLIGVEAEGMTACPCAQSLMRDRAAQRLQEEGFSTEQITRILDAVPLPTHNQRGRGRLVLSANPAIRAQDLVHIVEASMSSETYGILKRPDEHFIVSRAHRHPKFVEDVVRGMLAHVAEAYPELPGDTFVFASQVNFESIHKHNVFAERGATLADIRSSLAGQDSPSTSLAAWLDRQVM
jgi:GTP cyclohydrolase-4